MGFEITYWGADKLCVKVPLFSVLNLLVVVILLILSRDPIALDAPLS
jgi:hypothetical protein